MEIDFLRKCNISTETFSLNWDNGFKKLYDLNSSKLTDSDEKYINLLADKDLPLGKSDFNVKLYFTYN